MSCTVVIDDMCILLNVSATYILPYVINIIYTNCLIEIKTNQTFTNTYSNGLVDSPTID